MENYFLIIFAIRVDIIADRQERRRVYYFYSSIMIFGTVTVWTPCDNCIQVVFAYLNKQLLLTFLLEESNEGTVSINGYSLVYHLSLVAALFSVIILVISGTSQYKRFEHTLRRNIEKQNHGFALPHQNQVISIYIRGFKTQIATNRSVFVVLRKGNLKGRVLHFEKQGFGSLVAAAYPEVARGVH